MNISEVGYSGAIWPSPYSPTSGGGKVDPADESLTREKYAGESPIADTVPLPITDTSERLMLDESSTNGQEDQYENLSQEKRTNDLFIDNKAPGRNIGDKNAQASPVEQQAGSYTEANTTAAQKPWQANEVIGQASKNAALAPATSAVTDHQLAAQATVMVTEAKYDPVTNERLVDAAGAAQNSIASKVSAQALRPLEPAGKEQAHDQQLWGRRQKALSAYASQDKTSSNHIATA